MAWETRPGGLAAVFRFVQVIPSYSHVSVRYVLLAKPPKRTTRWRAPS